jgi:hypothetical protein
MKKGGFMNENIPGPAPEMGSIDILTLLVAALIMIIPFWRIFSKAGYYGWLSLLMVIPIVNIILLYYLAFAQWPILRGREGGQISNPPPPTKTA